MDDAFGNWLAGFIDGEGSFQISPIRGRTAGVYYRCVLAISLRADDAAILDVVSEHTGVGRVYYLRRKRTGHVVAQWTVQRKREALVMVEFLDRYPLRAKKARDYALWREAVLLWNDMAARHPGHHGRLPYDWSEIVALRERLIAGRAYDEPVLDTPAAL